MPEATRPVLEIPPQTECVPVLVCGAHMKGFPLHWQLEERGCTLRESAFTKAGAYKLYALLQSKPPKPALVRSPESESDEKNGKIAVEIYDMPVVHLGSFLCGIPYPLGLGKVQLESGEYVTGFTCAEAFLDDHKNQVEDITNYGGWKSYMGAKSVEGEAVEKKKSAAEVNEMLAANEPATKKPKAEYSNL